MTNLWGREPALIVAALQTALALAVGFGLDITAEQVSLILAMVTAVLGLIVRQTVYAPATVARDFEPVTAHGARINPDELFPDKE